MREIKFRAYHKIIGMVNNPRLDVVIGSKHYIVMQYTGLKDKNGKEIYEGDIVKGEKVTHSCGDEEDNYERKTEYGVGYFKWDEDELTYDIVISTPDYKYIDEASVELYSSTLEIIGNIYENPELLKEIKEQKD